MTDAATRLKKYRRAHGLSQEELGHAIGPMANQRSVANWELRRKRPSLANATAVEKLTGIPGTDWLKVRLVAVPSDKRRPERAA